MSTTNHSPLIRLQAAQRNYELACNACVHWGCESDGASYGCCYEMDDAQRELSAARVAFRRAGGSAARVSAIRRASDVVSV